MARVQNKKPVLVPSEGFLTPGSDCWEHHDPKRDTTCVRSLQWHETHFSLWAGLDCYSNVRLKLITTIFDDRPLDGQKKGVEYTAHRSQQRTLAPIDLCVRLLGRNWVAWLALLGLFLVALIPWLVSRLPTEKFVGCFVRWIPSSVRLSLRLSRKAVKTNGEKY